MKQLFPLLFLAFLSLSLSAQYANNWKLGNGLGLSFNTATPTLIGSAIASNHSDNSSTISDASGNLLFYTNGYTVWNKNNVVMPNGSGLIGDYTAGQCALIVPMPCNPNKYVIFQTTMFSNPGYLNYSVVDMTLNSGLGDVVPGQKNISLGNGWTEKICAYYSSSAKCFWVLTHKWNSNQFVAFKVDATSIATTSVVSSIGSVHSCGSVGGAHDAMGQLTISPDGSKVVNALTCQDKFEFFDFNLSTGVLSNSISIAGNGGNAWGTAFSPDSKKVYVNSIFGSSIFQYDISVFTSTAIAASLTNIYNTFTGGYNFGYMELGPDGKVYIPRPNTYFISAVNSPNLAGSACNYSFNAIPTGSTQSLWGTSRIAYNIPATFTSSPFTLTTITSSVSCNGMSNGSASITPSSPGNYSYSWSPGTNTTSFNYSLTAGNYTVTANSGCSTATTLINIAEPPVLTVAVDPLQICSGGQGPLNATASGGTPVYTYSWSTGATGPGIIVAPPVTTTYTVYVTDANGCTGNSAITVTVSNCAGVNEKQLISGISIYPNPFISSLNINSKVRYDEIIITNLLGKTVKRFTTEMNSIDLSDLQDGIYVIAIYDNRKTILTKKIVKSE
jgi:hypothetical protein